MTDVDWANADTPDSSKATTTDRCLMTTPFSQRSNTPQADHPTGHRG